MSRGLGKLQMKIIEYLAKGVTKIKEPGIINKRIKTGIYLPKTASIKEIVNHTGGDYQSVVRAVRKLEKKGVIVSRKSILSEILKDDEIEPDYKDMVIKLSGLGKAKWCKTVWLSKSAIRQLIRSPNADKYIFNLSEFIEKQKEKKKVKCVPVKYSQQE